MSNLHTFRNGRRVSDIVVHSQEPLGSLRPNPVLFVHGMWGGSWVWQRYVPQLSALGYHCHAMDLRGHGESESVDNAGEVSIEDYLEDVKKVAQSLKRPILVGHSMGGLLVLKLAELHDPAAIVLICPAQPSGNFGPPRRTQLVFLGRHLIALIRSKSIEFGRSEAKRTALNRVLDEDVDWVFQHSSKGSGRALREMILGKLSVDPSQVRCPILAIAASEDNSSPARVVERVASRYGAEYREYTNSGHMLPLEPMGKTAAEYISSWLENALAAA